MQRPFSRLFFAPAARLLALVLLATPFALRAQTLRQPGLVLDAKAWNDVRLKDESGETLLTLTGLLLKWTPNLPASDGSIREIVTAEGSPALEVDYSYSAPEAPSPIKATGRFVPLPGRLEVSYRLTGAPDDAKIGGSMFGRRLAQGAEDLGVQKLGLWQRHEHGGQPVEIPDGKLVRYRIGKQLLSFAFDADSKVNTDWKDAAAHHLGLAKVPDQAGAWSGRLTILLTPAGWPVEAVAAKWHARPLGLHLGTDQPFNWWIAPASGAARLELDATLVNTSDEARSVTVAHWARDFSGNIVSERKRKVSLAPGQVLADEIRIRPAARDSRREIFFTEVSAVDERTGKEVFARTNLTLLPPHEFKDGSAESIFGIAAYWPFPSEAEAQRVMDRMGVRWYRQGKTQNFKNITALRHNQIPWKITEPAEREKWLRENLQACVDDGNPAWEFGNEINYAVMSIGMGDVLKDEARTKRVAAYTEWLQDLRRVQKEMGEPYTQVKILTVGLAGMDVKFVQEMQKTGAWDLVDGIALHPGRGNFTPDYPVSEPWETWQVGAYGNYWNFYGSVRTAKELIKQLGGEKGLWLTEVYAPGFPNSFWEDSLRHGTENAILTFALAKAEGVEALMWYQLYDTVWHDKLGVDPKDREYYFGLIQRDLSFKPALLGYATAAEELDQAKFVRWLHFPDDAKTRGLLFDTPRGPMAVLWDRSDGYILSKKVPDFASPEPWVDTWKTKVATTLPVGAGRALTVINPIGQRRAIAAKHGEAVIELTGAPAIVYGLDAAKLK